jgi:hypothetical protein
MIEETIRRVERMARRASFAAAGEAITTRRMTPAERMRALSRIMAAVASGKITPREANALAKAVQP